MNKLALVGLCIAGIAANGYLTSRVNRNQAIREIDEHVKDAVETYMPSSGKTLADHVVAELKWFRWHKSSSMAISAHSEEFELTLNKAINQAVYNAK